MGEEVKITVIATGFRDQLPDRRERMLADATLLTSRHEAPQRYDAPPPRIEQRHVAAPFVSETQVPSQAFSSARQTPQPVIAPMATESREVVGEAAEDVEYSSPEERAQNFRERFPGFQQERVRQSEPTASQRIQAYTEPGRDFEFEGEAPRGMSERAAALERALAEVGGEPVIARGQGTPGAYIPEAPTEPRPELVPVPASVFDDDFFRKPNEELRAANAKDAAWPEARVPTFAGYAADAPAETDELDIPAFLRRNH